MFICVQQREGWQIAVLLPTFWITNREIYIEIQDVRFPERDLGFEVRNQPQIVKKWEREEAGD